MNGIKEGDTIFFVGLEDDLPTLAQSEVGEWDDHGFRLSSWIPLVGRPRMQGAVTSRDLMHKVAFADKEEAFIAFAKLVRDTKEIASKWLSDLDEIHARIAGLRVSQGLEPHYTIPEEPELEELPY
jgi:hypothetical protein